MDNRLSRDEKKKFVQQVIEEHQNLDLRKYKPYVHKFQKYSRDMFDFDTIFSKNLKGLEQPPYPSPKKLFVEQQKETRSLSPEIYK